MTQFVLKEMNDLDGKGKGRVYPKVVINRLMTTEDLVQRMQECGLKEKDYQFYLDLRKYGSTRHAGFGLGFERCVMYLTGISNIRDVLPFPRTVGNCEL